MNQTKKKRILMIAESAIMIALGTVLSLIAFAPWPQGGSITVFSMLPVLIIAYRYGIKWGLGVGAVYGLLQMILGMSALSYATNALAAICIVLFDYVVAFGVLGFGGLFRKMPNQAVGFTLGVTVACLLRFLCHFLTGVTVWADYAKSLWGIIIYSLSYNGSYMLPELVITALVGALLTSLIDFRGEKLRPIRKAK